MEFILSPLSVINRFLFLILATPREWFVDKNQGMSCQGVIKKLICPRIRHVGTTCRKN